MPEDLSKIPIEKFISDWIEGKCRLFTAEIEEWEKNELDNNGDEA